MSISSRVRRLCEQNGITINQLEKESKIGRGSVSRWDDHSPSVDKAIAVASYFSVSVDYLLCLTDDSSPVEQREKAASGLSPAEHSHIQKYRSLDDFGQEAVDAILDIEYQRVKAANAVQEASKVEIASEIAPEPEKVIPLFTSAAAAGIASPVLGEDYENYVLKKNDPQRAIMAIRVQGDSMEPYFPDGSIVFCDKTPMKVGDIGVFILDGGSLLKQWCPDNYGNAYLFSLNRKRADADVTVWSTSNQNLTCMGRVITNKRFPLP